MYTDLTPREMDVLRLMARGQSNKEIASTLCIARSTVNSHVHHILASIGVRNRVEAALWAYDRGLMPPREMRADLPGRAAKSTQRRIDGAQAAI